MSIKNTTYEPCTEALFYLTPFANDMFKVLDYISDSQQPAGKNGVAVIMTQQGLADACGVSKHKLNRIVNDLEECGFLFCKRNCYKVTERGMKAIYLMKKPNV